MHVQPMLWLVSHACSAKADFVLLELETALECSFRQSPHSIELQHVFSDRSKRDLGFCKNMFQRLKAFQGNLDTRIIDNSPDWFHNSLKVLTLKVTRYTFKKK